MTWKEQLWHFFSSFSMTSSSILTLSSSRKLSWDFLLLLSSVCLSCVCECVCVCFRVLLNKKEKITGCGTTTTSTSENFCCCSFCHHYRYVREWGKHFLFCRSVTRSIRIRAAKQQWIVSPVCFCRSWCRSVGSLIQSTFSHDYMTDIVFSLNGMSWCKADFFWLVWWKWNERGKMREWERENIQHPRAVLMQYLRFPPFVCPVVEVFAVRDVSFFSLATPPRLNFSGKLYENVWLCRHPVGSFRRFCFVLFACLNVCLIPAFSILSVGVQKCMKRVGVGFHLSLFFRVSKNKLDVTPSSTSVSDDGREDYASLSESKRKSRHMPDKGCVCVVVVEMPHRGWTVFLCTLFDCEKSQCKEVTQVSQLYLSLIHSFEWE